MALAALIAALQYWNRASLPAHVTVIGWHEDWPEFGGWSGLDVTPDGQRAWLVSDGSLLAQATLLRTPGGTLRGVQATSLGFVIPRLDPPPAFHTNRSYRDAESLSLDADDTPLVSFENIPRLIAIEPGGAQVARPALQVAEGRNSGVEAYAIGPDGTGYAIPERPPAVGWPYTLWINTGDRWRVSAKIPRKGRFRASGADIGPDGHLYLLERGITLFGFVSRVRRIDPAAPDQITTVYRAPPGRHGNLEGLGVWRDSAGHLRLTMIEDDNFLWFQRGHIVEARLPLALSTAQD